MAPRPHTLLCPLPPTLPLILPQLHSLLTVPPSPQGGSHLCALHLERSVFPDIKAPSLTSGFCSNTASQAFSKVASATQHGLLVPLLPTWPLQKQ